MMKRLLLAAVFLYGTQLWAETLYVPTERYPDIQAAINDANDGDTVIVDRGTYFENLSFLGKSIVLRSTDPNDPNVVAGTVIDGSHSGDPNIGSVATFANGEGAGSVLSGFTITGGTGSWLAISWEFRGLQWNRCGGGVVCYNMSAPTITQNRFINNLAGQGGGIYIYGDPVNGDDPSDPDIHLSPIITNNTFVNNSAVVEHGFAPPNDDYPNNDHGDGGAIVAFQGCDAVITGNSMLNNHADMYGGAIHVRQWSKGLIEGNRVEGNDSALGAGIHVTYISSPTIRDNLIRANTAGGLGGGGIYVYYYSSPPIEQNIITQNTSSNGAGIAIHWESSPIVRNNLIYRNYSGAGIQIVGGSPAITHNTITHNYYNGIDCRSAGPIIENNIISSNERGYGIAVRYGSSPVIRYNNIWGNSTGGCGPDVPDQTGINGNITVDPGFVDPDANDYHLNYGSRCINSADPNLAFEGLTDYDGDPRKLGRFADIGADEAWPTWNISSSGQYENIQQAIDDANDGETIIITMGTHLGPGNRDIEFKGKAITVQSADPNDSEVVAGTIIDSEGSASEPHRGFHIRGGENANSVIAGLTITGGVGRYEGGAIRCCLSSPTIKNCLITDNLSGGRAGGIYCGDGSNPTIANCTFTGNAAVYGYGGAICCMYDSSPVITNCIMTGNAAIGEGHHGGGIYCHDHSDAIISGCFISGNTADHRGGGISAYWSNPTIVNCTVIGNFSLEGGGISSFREANPVVANCIVRNNRSPEGNQLALINTLGVWGATSIPTEMTVLYSDIEGGSAGAYVETGYPDDPSDDCILHWGLGNIDVDPNLANSGYWDDANAPGEPNDDFFVVGDFHLLPGSPCIDSGDNGSIPPGSNTDLDEEERVFADTVDMGADEVVTHPFDLNNDGIIDYLELIVLTGQWLRSGQSQADFHEDGFIDFLDYARLADYWHWKSAWRR
jgi:parallel beta-helix repeat protein